MAEMAAAGNAGKVIAVTGASRGIGAAIARELARRGNTVGCLTRKGAGIEGATLDPTLAERLLNLTCDVNDEASVKQAFATLAHRAGRIDGLVNNAGVHLYGKSTEFSTAKYEEVMNTNARSVFVCAREAYPHLAAAGGTIVNIGSFFEKLGVKQNLAYCASKAAVGAITRCLAVEWADKRIRVLNVAPGYIETDLNAEAMKKGALHDFLAARVPTGGPGTAAEVARLVAMLFAEDLPFLTGETITIDGGQGMAH
jgi:NAD(P)-dependent dehydrogenase (short-subunit alcohol dehydrogenase family)